MAQVGHAISVLEKSEEEIKTLMRDVGVRGVGNGYREETL